MSYWSLLFLITAFPLQMRTWEKSHWSPFNISLASVFAFNKRFQPAWSYKKEKLKIWHSNHISPQREPFFYPGGSRRPLHCASAWYALWIEDIFILKYDIWVKILSEVVTNLKSSNWVPLNGGEKTILAFICVTLTSWQIYPCST